MRCRIGAAAARRSALPDEKLIVSLSVTIRSESRNVTSQPVWSSSSGAGSSARVRRSSGRTLPELGDTAWSLGGADSHVRAQHALDARGVLPPVHEQDAVDQHLAPQVPAGEVSMQL